MTARPPNRLTFTKSRLETADTNPIEAVKYQLRMGAPDEFTPFSTFQSTITLTEIYTGTPNAYGLHIMERMEQTIQRVSQLETLQQQSASTIIGLQQQLGSA